MRGSPLRERRRDVEHAAVRVLASSFTIEEAAPEILRGICEALGWEVAVLWTVDPGDERLHCREFWRVDDPRLVAFEHACQKRVFERGEGLPGRIWENERPIWVRDVREEMTYPRAPAAKEAGLRGGFGFPIVVREKFFGVMEFVSYEVNDEDEDLLELVASIGLQIGQLIEREQMDQRLRNDQDWLAFVAEATTTMSHSLDYRAELHQLAQLVVPTLADWCVIHVVEPNEEIRPVAMAHVDPALAETVRQVQASYPVDLSSEIGVGAAIRTGTSILYGEDSETFLMRTGSSPESIDWLGILGFRSAMIVPLICRGRALGALTLVSTVSGRRYTTDDLRLVEDLAGRVAFPIDNARLYEERARVARTLQENLLPPALPAIPGVELAARYYAAAAGADVGGDFYDAFPTGSRSWGLVLGDVSGKGVEAAAITALARHTIRTAAMTTARPSNVLNILNAALIEQIEDERFCTAVYARVEPRFGRLLVTAACGGHPPPYVVRSDGTVERVECEGALLGLLPDPALVDVTVELRFGDKLVLYTDGLVDFRHDGRIFAPEHLEGLLSECGKRGVTASADLITETVVEFQDGSPRDDIALIACGVRASIFRVGRRALLSRKSPTAGA